MEDGWTATVIAETTLNGKFRPVLVLTWTDEGVERDVTIPLPGEYDSRMGAEEAGKDAIAEMTLPDET
ncbi:hypothetical protein [Roseateles sp.]|uniref:hypothetical protein n=1 Tax=Roseateles sp. TaxID=1971397 RepID=UPI0031D7AC87